ncbi:unannotated protein [freshwater metagenome]|uniref:Unannotated protein n=1 Tax=freshwater metagenome TaxID=449393 RepID=A0A6J7I1G6_9ZZZZ|nr:hypothetical protein [Actinomycetota bacterium]
MNIKTIILAAAGVALVGAGIAAPSMADPTTTGRVLNGMGSDTTQFVMNGFSKTTNGANVASWDASGSSKVDMGNEGCTAVNRANGSTAGRTALKNNDPAGCLQYARSSSFSADDLLTYYPFAIDGLTFAVTQTSSVPRTLTKAQLIAIYRCETNFEPVLPQTGSGSRADWLKYVFGVTSIPAGVDTSCYLGGGTDNTVLPQEHNGIQLTDNQVVGYSVAQWVSQENGSVSDVRGRTVLGLLDDKSPLMLNPGGANVRTVYNVVRRADGDAIAAAVVAGNNEGLNPVQIALKAVFHGSNSFLCSDTATIIKYGFAPVPAGATYGCGTQQLTS